MNEKKKREEIETIITKLLNRKREELEKTSDEEIRKTSETFSYYGMGGEGIKAIYDIQLNKIKGLVDFFMQQKFNLFKQFGLSLTEDDLSLLAKQASKIAEGAFPHLKSYYEKATIHGNLPDSALEHRLRQIEDDKNKTIGYVKDEVEIKGKLFRAEISMKKDTRKKKVPNWLKWPNLYASPVNLKIYEELYSFENRLRHLVHRILKIKYGQDWLKKIPQQILLEAKKRMKQSLDIPYLERRPSIIIWYCFLSELKTIITSKSLWPIFRSYFKPKELFEQKMKELNYIRNRLAHNKILLDEALDTVKSSSRTILKQAVVPEKLAPLEIKGDTILGAYNKYLIQQENNQFLIMIFDQIFEYEVNIGLRSIEDKNYLLAIMGTNFIEIMDKNIDLFTKIEYRPFTGEGPQLAFIISKVTAEKLICDFLDEIITSSLDWIEEDLIGKPMLLLGNLAGLPEYFDVYFTYIPLKKELSHEN